MPAKPWHLVVLGMRFFALSLKIFSWSQIHHNLLMLDRGSSRNCPLYPKYLDLASQILIKIVMLFFAAVCINGLSVNAFNGLIFIMGRSALIKFTKP